MTTSVAGSTPTLSTSYDGRFPRRDDFDAVWSGVLEASAIWRDTDCAEHIRNWCGSMPDQVAASLTGVNHVGIYLGDYERDDEVLDWHAYLVELQKAGHITDVEMGPSYISPRQYGTQGWWISLLLPNGCGIETFTCKHYGPWLKRSVAERRRLMSHIAVDVRSEADVRSALDTLEHQAEHLEIIAFTAADELGHTYGHLRNNTDQTVLEIVHQAAREEGGSPDGTR